MTAETISAIASVGTFIVIAVTAFAALIQLRHIRAGNQLSGILHYTTQWESDNIQSAANFIDKELAAKLREPEYQKGLWDLNPDRRVHQELRVADWCEQLGSYIKYGMISDEQYLDIGAWYVASMWDNLREVVAIRRAATGSSAMYENFEFLASRAKAYGAAHQGGNYPRRVARLLSSEEWKKLKDPRTTPTGSKIRAEPK